MSLSKIIENIIFRPVKLAPGHRFHFEHEFEEFFFYPEKEVAINALHFKLTNPKGVILYFHGNKDNLARWGKIASELVRYQYDVIVIDYRGYGKSSGERTEDKLYSDALFCGQQIQEKFNPDRLVLYGRSLGTGIASWLAGQMHPHALILETPYYNMHDLVGRFFPGFLYKNKLNFRFNSFAHLQKARFPILILHGTKDEVVPYQSGLKLFQSLPDTPKIFCSLPGGKHNDLYKFERYWKQLEEFLN